MKLRKAQAVWEGTLKEGGGRLALGSGAFQGSYTFQSRFEEGEGTNPEELIAAAYAGCFTMFLSSLLTQAGYRPKSLRTSAEVRLEMPESGPQITRIHLETEADVPGLDEPTLLQHVQAAKENCPVSKALASVDTEVSARLLGSG